MKLNTSEWKPFVTQKLFSDMQSGKASQQMLSEGNDCFYVGAKKEGNGVMCHCARDEKLMTRGNCIIFICNGQGSVGFANYMDEDFIGSTDIVAGYNEHLNMETGTFLATIYSQERPKYSFGRKWKTHLKDTVVRLPARHNDDGTLFIDESKKYSEDGYVPDWQFMENYMKSLHHKPLTTKNQKGQAPDLNIKSWKSFSVGRLFTMLNGKGITQEEIAENAGDFIAVQSGEDNNGVMGKIDLNYCKKMKYTYSEKPCLTVARSGSAGFVSYQKYGCVVGDSAKILLLPNEVAKTEHYLFLQTILTANRFKYTYGHKVTENKYLDDVIDLPIQHNTDGSILTDSSCKYSDEGYIPDWKFMENYIRSLPYGDRI